MSKLDVSLLAAHGLTERTAATWSPALPRDPRVLTPVVLDALVVRQTGAAWADTQVRRADPNSNGLVDAATLRPKPFAMRATDRPLGVYLHWALPDALTRGEQVKDTSSPDAATDGDRVKDTILFPALPDRWLVTRIFPSATHPDRRAVRSWILQAHDDDPQPIDLDAWHEPGPPPAAPENTLTAMGYGDVSWAGYFDSTLNRLAFYDDLADVKAGPIAYLVCGWYSNPGDDPLGPAKVSSLPSFNARLQELGWTLGTSELDSARVASSAHVEAARSVGLPVTSPRANPRSNMVVSPGAFDAGSGVFQAEDSWWPQMSLLHGAVVGIGWPGIGWEGNPLGVWNPDAVGASNAALADPVGGPPDPSTIEIAVGNTIAETMAKLVATDQDRADEARVLEAFQMNALATLDEPDGAARIDALLHASAFASLPAGEKTETIWQPPTSVTEAPPAVVPPPDPGVFSRYKHASPGSVTGGLGNIGGVVSATTGTVKTAPKISAEVLSQITVVDASFSDVVNQQLPPEPPVVQPGQWVEVKRALPRFFRPGDPVLLIEGGKASFKHKPASFSPDGLLHCRLTGDVATAVSTTPPGAALVTVNGADLLERGIENGGVPPECEELLRELVVLDPGSAVAAGHAAAPAGTPGAAMVQALTRSFSVEQTAWHATRDPRIDHAPLLSLSGISGQLPSPIAISLPVHPWSPIRVDWQVQYLPSVGGVADWDLGELDYAPRDVQPGTPTTFEGSSPLAQGSAPIMAAAIRHAQEQAASAAGAGITNPAHVIAFFSPSAQKALQDLQQIKVATDPAQQGVPAAERLPLDDLASALADMDVLTAGLDGLNTLLRGGFVGDGHAHPGDGAADPAPFFALRGGFLKITKLRLIDGFGQFVDLLADPARPVIASDPMTVSEHPDLLALPPRFTSPGRLTLRFVDGGGSGSEAMLDPKTGNTISPVCGYLMPNHLDGAVEFFDVDGGNLGFVRPDGDTAVVWEEAPGIPSAVGQDPARAVSNSFAAGIAKGLLRWGIQDAGLEPGKDTALQALLRVIDSVLWSVDPFGHAGDEHLSLLVGHPVVIARARLRLEVQEPVHPEQANLAAVPVRLGALAHWQDGLFGYFVNDDYTTLHCSDAAAAGLARAVGPQQGFLQPINLVPDHFEGFAAATGSTPIDHPFVDTSGVIWVRPNQNVDLTFLLEPHTAVHVTTGLLPRKDIGLRREWIADALAKLSPTFRFGPLLCDPQRIRMPIATDIAGTWSWDYRADASTWAELPITNATQDALLPPDPPSGTEGWMRLTPPAPEKGSK